jgi:tetratricopeptide (TPR) repeat protein
MIIISAKDAVDIGKAFEEFIAILLSKLGYSIENMRVRRAGRELDIRASSKITGLPLLVECKGLSKPLTGPSFSKFYGVYDHEYRKSNSNLMGLLISLTGFNSEVLDYYQEKDERVRERFRIIGPEQILKFAVEADLISDDLTVQHLTRRSWPFELGETLLIITATQYYRVQLLKKDGRITHFIAYRAKCEDPTEYEVNMLHQNVRLLKKLESFDLSARKQILLALSQAQESTSCEELSSLTKQSVITVSTELSYLKDRNFVEESGKGRFVLVHDIRSFCEVSKELLASQYKYDFLLSLYFRQMNNVHLSTYCLSRRFISAEDAQEHPVLSSVFQYSPAALNQALFGDIERYRVTHEHALQIKPANSQEITNIGRGSFYTEIVPHLLKDLHDRDNAALHELESIVGLREEYHIVLATTVRQILDLTAGGIIVQMKAGEAVKAGQLVTTDIGTVFNLSMTTFNLTQDRKNIDEMIKTYHDFQQKGGDLTTLAIMSNCIGRSLIVLQDWSNAKEWFVTGLTHDNTIPQLHGNLARVLEEIGDASDAVASFEQAKKLDPDYGLKLQEKQ